MITDAIFDVFFGVINAAFSLLPSGAGLVIPGSPSWSVLATANLILPIDYVLVLFGVASGFMTVGLVYWGVMKVFNMIRGSGA